MGTCEACVNNGMGWASGSCLSSCDMIADIACYSDVAGCSLYYEAERVITLCKEQTNCAACTLADGACAWNGGSCFSTANAWRWDSAWILDHETCDLCVTGTEDLSNPCQPKKCLDGKWAITMVECPETMGVPCEGGSYEPALDGECCSRCVKEMIIKPYKVSKKRTRKRNAKKSKKRSKRSKKHQRRGRHLAASVEPYYSPKSVTMHSSIP